MRRPWPTHFTFCILHANIWKVQITKLVILNFLHLLDTYVLRDFAQFQKTLWQILLVNVKQWLCFWRSADHASW